MEQRWMDKGTSFTKGNKVAFHVDRDFSDRRFRKLIQEQEVTLAIGQGSKSIDSRIPLGSHVLHLGMEMSLESYGNCLDTVMADIDFATMAILECFTEIIGPFQDFVTSEFTSSDHRDSEVSVDAAVSNQKRRRCMLRYCVAHCTPVRNGIPVGTDT